MYLQKNLGQEKIYKSVSFPQYNHELAHHLLHVAVRNTVCVRGARSSFHRPDNHAHIDLVVSQSHLMHMCVIIIRDYIFV